MVSRGTGNAQHRTARAQQGSGTGQNGLLMASTSLSFYQHTESYERAEELSERHAKFNPDGSQGKMSPRHNIILSGVPGIGEDILKQENFPKNVWRRT
jgi:hypothetical protein